MENTFCSGRRWEEMGLDVLVKIFLSLNIIELTSGVSRVCSSWRLACCDPVIWKIIDFGVMKSNYIKIPAPPYIWVADTSDKFVMRTLKIAMGLSRGNCSCLIIPLDLYLKDAQLIYIAERSPHLKQLVLPTWNRITKSGICAAVRNWKELESLTMPSIRDPPYFLDEIARSCKNFTQLKIMGHFDVLFASTIAERLPNLKVLSLRCSLLYKEALDIILDNLEHLKVLNISHSFLVEKPPPPATKRILRQLDESIRVKASRLRIFLTCQDEFCVLCQRMITDDGYLRWYKYEKRLWMKDEV
ncbi:hypothetical protein AQUCO_03500260v1 [Aquilegia coerulea]|uniref:F-box domain-containing protein n=1 Tax=Aquilegia coerulea TaxID=218851 RepID=A0A2G5CWX7_AQUCA|nr:hypothetical protein AQUCO_03500260v1 [Aquilegia coerulea]